MIDVMVLRKDTSLDLFLLALMVAGLFIPSVYVRAVAICVIGYLIYRHELRIGLLTPASPGVMFWLGNFCSYVLGGITTGLFFSNWDGYGMRYLRDAMFYIGLGLAFFLMGAWVVRFAPHPGNRTKDITKDLVLNQRSIALICGIYCFSVFGRQVLPLGPLGPIYDNLVVGMVQSVETIPIILFGIYVTHKNRNLLGLIMLAGAAFSVPFYGILMGYGRGKVIRFFLFTTIVWISLEGRKRFKLPMKPKIAILAGAIVIVLIFGVQTNYRSYYSNDNTRVIMQRREMILGAMRETRETDTLLKDTFGAICSRANELNSLELFGRAKYGIIPRSGWNMNDLKQVLFSWIPKSFSPNKGHMMGREIMVFYGFGEGNIPPSLLGDVFRRSGAVGIIAMYFILGVLSTLVAVKLRNSWGGFGILVSYYLALLMFDMYVQDAVNCFTVFVYRLPSSAIAIYIILRISGILPAQSRKKPCYGLPDHLMKTSRIIE